MENAKPSNPSPFYVYVNSSRRPLTHSVVLQSSTLGDGANRSNFKRSGIVKKCRCLHSALLDLHSRTRCWLSKQNREPGYGFQKPSLRKRSDCGWNVLILLISHCAQIFGFIPAIKLNGKPNWAAVANNSVSDSLLFLKCQIFGPFFLLFRVA